MCCTHMGQVLAVWVGCVTGLPNPPLLGDICLSWGLGVVDGCVNEAPVGAVFKTKHLGVFITKEN